MIHTNPARRLALALVLCLTWWVPSARAQAPAADPNSPPPSPNWSRQPDPNVPPINSPPPAPAQPIPGTPLIPFAVPAPPGGPVVPPIPTPPRAEDIAAGPGTGLDTPFRGGGGFSPFMDPVVGLAPYRAAYRVTWLSSEPVAGQPTKLGYVLQDLSVSFPLWQNGTCDEWSAFVNVRNEIYQTHAVLPDTGQPFPDDLWNVRLGTTYRHLFDNGWIGGGTVSVGSASDRPFHSSNEITAGVNAFLRVPSGEHNAWLFSLSYSPTGELPIPIPGVAYVWQPSDTFRANLGLPFVLMWRPLDDLTLDLSYMLLTTVHARATYRLSRPVRLYVAYASENEGYLLAGRPDNRDRFYNVDQRLTAGTLIHFGPHTALDLSGGYVFDHYYFEGRSITSGTHFNRVDVGDGPYLSVQFQVRW